MSSSSRLLFALDNLLTMAKASINNRVCGACGSDVRSNALFCYHCGGSVAPDIVTALKDKKTVSDAWFRENTNAENNGVPIQNEPETVGESADKPIPKPEFSEEPKLQSAASMRRKPKNIQPKKIEVIWEEHENAPNGWFIFAAVVLTLFAVGILFLARYLK